MNKHNSSINVRPVHRIVGTIILVFTLYIGTTGLSIQAVDLHTIATHAAATDPEMMAIRESIDGTDNYAVIQPADYAAAALPAGFDFGGALSKVIRTARLTLGDDAPLSFLELRVIAGKPIALVRAGKETVRFDPSTGGMLANPPEPMPQRPPPSLRGQIKRWHRMTILQGPAGDLMESLNALIGIALFIMIVTGLVLYFQLLRARMRSDQSALFWFTGGWYRSLHRWVSIVAAVFLMVVSISGTLLSIDTVSMGLYGVTHSSAPSRFPIGITGDFSSPLQESKLPAMLNTTLTGYHASQGDTSIRVLRLRYFSGMPQGVIVTGDDARQLVFNAETGQKTSMTEPGYPYTGFPFGWEEHELMKKIHRGDAFGIPGRLMDVFAGLSLVFLSTSGLVMYLDVLRKRRRGGRKQLFWN